VVAPALERLIEEDECWLHPSDLRYIEPELVASKQEIMAEEMAIVKDLGWSLPDGSIFDALEVDWLRASTQRALLQAATMTPFWLDSTASGILGAIHGIMYSQGQSQPPFPIQPYTPVASLARDICRLPSAILVRLSVRNFAGCWSIPGLFVDATTAARLIVAR